MARKSGGLTALLAVDIHGPQIRRPHGLACGHLKHVEGAYKQAHPKTVYDATGRMVDSPPIAIAFNPFGDEVPRAQPQNAGFGTGMPGIMKTSFPAADLMPVRETAPIKGPEISSDNRRSARSDSAFQSSSKPEETQIAQAPAQGQQRQRKPLPSQGVDENGKPVFNIIEADYRKWEDALDRAGIAGPERAFFEQINAWEGGMKKDGETRAGISPRALQYLVSPDTKDYYGQEMAKELVKEGIKPGMKPEHLTFDQQVIFYRVYFTRAIPASKSKGRSGDQLLAELPDKAASMALAHTLWRVGYGEPTIRQIQEVANSASVKAGGKPVITDVDGIYGSDTHTALKTMLADPKKAAAFVDGLADIWTKSYKDPGDIRRVEWMRTYQ